LKEQLEELEENKRERKIIDEQNTIDGDTDYPHEVESALELEGFDELIRHNLETIVELINWLSRFKSL